MAEGAEGGACWARLFIGLWPDVAEREALLAHQRSWVWPPRAACTQAPRLHATLHFLGDVARERLPSMRAALRVPVNPFEMTFDRDELWPAGIAVLATTVPAPPLLDLHARLAQVLRVQGLRCERRPYRPHVTLARRAAGAVVPAEPPAIRWLVRGYELIESHPAAGRYEVLERYS